MGTKNKLWDIQELNGERVVRLIKMNAPYPVALSKKKELERTNKLIKYKIIYAKQFMLLLLLISKSITQ